MNIDDSNDDFDVGYCLKNKDVLKCVKNSWNSIIFNFNVKKIFHKTSHSF